MLADQLFLLMDGAYMGARMFGTDNPGKSVAEAARMLIEAQVKEPAKSAWGNNPAAQIQVARGLAGF
jgi:hypothetical protein